jgi:hypothetical protein
MYELQRTGLGPGKVIVDAVGVTWRGLWRTRSVRWDELRGYRLGIELERRTSALVDLHGGLSTFDPFGGALWDALRGREPPRRVMYAIALCGPGAPVEVSWRYFGVEQLICDAIGRVHAATIARLRDDLAMARVVRFADLTMSGAAIQWGRRPLLPAAEVESIELFDAYPVRLRVMQRRRAWPYAQAPTARVPDLLAVLELAATLGYRVKGAELVAGLLTSPPAAMSDGGASTDG